MLLVLLLAGTGFAASQEERLRVIVETDAGGDPDDEQSLVRFLVYANEWDVEGILCNRAVARERENRNVERTGLGIVRAMIRAYGECHPKLALHDPRFPSAERLREKAVDASEGSNEGVKLILAAVDRDDPRPVWFMNWGTDHGAAPSSLLQALDLVRRERGPDGYAKFKRRLRLSSADKFGDHTAKIEPPFPFWVDTFRPALSGRRWYHRFSALTAKAGGFDIERDVRSGHGPLGALYPTNTTHGQKEGDSMTFLYLVPTGMNDPGEPSWGSWAGRYGPNDEHPGKPYHWANVQDAWQGTTDRDHTLRRWAVHLQNDFKARMDWCVKDAREANHPPQPGVRGPLLRAAAPGEKVVLDASDSRDPDGNGLRFEWIVYPEAGTWRGDPPPIADAGCAEATLTVPGESAGTTIHVVLQVTDDGDPPLTRYRRVILRVR